MKIRLFAPCLALVVTSCAGVHVSHTSVASGATHPAAIYIRPFDISQAEFIGDHSNRGERPIRRSLAPAQFAEDLKEEMEMIAPAMVLKDNEVPRTGWLVEGTFDEVNGGKRALRALSLGPLGKSHVKIHVRITDAGARQAAVDGKDAKDETETSYAKRGNVLYEFDLDGGSNWTGFHGSVTAPGLGDAAAFDFRNAAERVMMALSTDPHAYGSRTSPTIR